MTMDDLTFKALAKAFNMLTTSPGPYMVTLDEAPNTTYHFALEGNQLVLVEILVDKSANKA